MACLRGQTPDGRRGVVQCDEEGCKFRLIPRGATPEDSPREIKGDCVLQLRLRAGDSEGATELTSIDPDHKVERFDRTSIGPIAHDPGELVPRDQRFIIGNDGADDSRRDERRYLEQARSEPDRESSVFYWSEYVGEWIKQWEDLSLKEQFEVLRRRGPKWSRAEYSQLAHIERHLDRGDIICKCGKD